LLTGPCFWLLRAEEPTKDPELVSVFPPGGQAGTSFKIEMRGKALSGAYAISCVPEASSCEDLGIRAMIPKVESITLDHDTDTAGKKTVPDSRVFIPLRIDRRARIGVHQIRVVLPAGISTAIPFTVSSSPVIDEAQTPHSSPATAQ